ncbi:MAG TPA: glycosyltransferase family 4 protein [Geobacterales bacterium]|nr:glycosyltransferase family 4 protein [Geobacterales bacterium]
MENINRKNKEKIGIIIIGSSLFEVPYLRNIPSGFSEIIYKTSNYVSKKYDVIIISPFYYKYKNDVIINKNLKIYYVYHPAIHRQKISIINIVMELLSSILSFSTQSALKILSFRSQQNKVVIIYDKISGIFPLIIAKIIGFKVIYSEGNPFPWYLPYLNKKYNKISWGINIFLGKIMCKNADIIRAQSICIKEGMIHQGIEKEKIFVIPVGVDPIFFKPSYNKDKSSFIVGYLGRLTEEKGGPLLYEIVKESSLKLPQVKFLIIGLGPYKDKLEKLNNVIFIGNVQRKELPQFINMADIFISTYYDFALADLEILSCGKPLIKLDSPEINYIFKNKEEILYAKNDINSFLKIITEVMNDQKLIEKISHSARDKILKDFTWEKISEKWIELIDILLKRNNKKTEF